MSRTREIDLLLLHTSAAVGTVALSRGDRLAIEVLDSTSQHARTVLGAVERLLIECDARLTDLDGLVVTTGPGSFTGIRIGLGTAQGLAAACTWDVYACNSLLAEAAAYTDVPEPLAVVLDARRGEVYAALYDVRGAAPDELLPPFCAGPAEALARLLRAASTHERSTRDARIAVAGSGADLLPVDASPDAVRVTRLQALEHENIARALLRLGRAGACERIKPEHVEPLYLRKSDAEIRRENRGTAR